MLMVNMVDTVINMELCLNCMDATDETNIHIKMISVC